MWDDAPGSRTERGAGSVQCILSFSLVRVRDLLRLRN